MADLNSLSKYSLSLSALSGLIVVTPDPVGYQPQSENEEDVEPPRFLFTYEGQNQVILTSDITDHFVEDNTARQDHIALPPEIIKVRGYIGELTGLFSGATPLPELRVFNEKLVEVNAYLSTPRAFGGLTNNIQEITDTAAQSYQVARNIRNNIISAQQNAPVQNQQQKAFNFFYGYWRERRLFRVQTPWKVFNNMAIEKIEMSQDEDEFLVTNIELDFKMIRFVENPLSPENRIKSQGRLKYQNSPRVDFGQITPSVESPLSRVWEKASA